MATREALLENKLQAASAREVALHLEISRLESQLAARKQGKGALDAVNDEHAAHHVAFVNLGQAVRKVVHEFMDDVKYFQLWLKDYDSIPSTPRSCRLGNPGCKCTHVHPTAELAGSEGLRTCMATLRLVTQCANSGLSQATKDWRTAQARVAHMTKEAKECLLNTILGKGYNFTQVIRNPKAIDFRIEPIFLESERELQAKRKVRRILNDHLAEMEANQNKPAEAAAGTSSNAGVKPNLDA